MQAHREAVKGWSEKAEPEFWTLNQFRIVVYLEERRNGNKQDNLREALAVLEKARPVAEKHLEPVKLFEFEVMLGDMTMNVGTGGEEAVLKNAIAAFERALAVGGTAVTPSRKGDAYVRIGVLQSELAVLPGQDRMGLLKKAQQSLTEAQTGIDQKKQATLAARIDVKLKEVEGMMKGK